MVVPSPITPLKSNKKTKALGIPIINLSQDRTIVRDLIVKACEDYGIFKVINHGISYDIVSRLEDEGRRFFDRPVFEKNRAGPAQPFGYGFKSIGFNGDVGELEYLLLHTNPQAVTEKSKLISNDPTTFSSAVNDYTHSVKNLACEILDLVGEGLWLQDKSIFSNLIRDTDNDSLLRINHYPQFNEVDGTRLPSSPNFIHSQNNEKVGFGEHSDPQILTILRSNDVSGLQIRLSDGTWIPVPPDPTDFCVFAGDALQAMTNGKLVSVRHRAIINSMKPRMSMVFFGAPPLNYMISPLEEMVSTQKPSLYKPFTWSDYKTTTYSHRLAHSRLNLFKLHPDNAIHTEL